MYPEKVPRKVILLWFFGVWNQRRSRVVPKTPRAPYKVKSGRNLYKKGCAKLDFCDVFLYLVPD